MRRGRVAVLGAVLAVSIAALAGAAATGGDPAPSRAANGTEPGHTLVAIQAFGWFDEDNGEVQVVAPDGDVVWRYDPPHAWVFDAELTPDGTVLVSMGQSGLAPAVACPERYGGERSTPGKHDCIRNRVVEIDFATKEVVWEHAWYDAFPTHHEVHDADRLPNGETLIADMGNHRAFRVNEAGEITWEWRAANHIAPGTAFWEQYVAPLPEKQRADFRRSGKESDWTHLNDVDRLPNGNYRLSIRNFDTVVEVDPGTKAIERVIGAPGRHRTMNEQHNPHPLPRGGTTLIADSENDRVIELARNGTIVWRYDGTGSGSRLQWPRDADRLPNGNTLVTDSRNFRVLEVDPNGTVVWRHSFADRKGIVYEADRIRLPNASGRIPEEPIAVPSAVGSGRADAAILGGAIAAADAWLGFVLPAWMGLGGAIALVAGSGALLGLLYEGARARRRH